MMDCLKNLPNTPTSLIITQLRYEIWEVRSLGVLASGLGYIVEKDSDTLENLDAMAGLGAGIQRLLAELSERTDNIEAALIELLDRCSPGHSSDAFSELNVHAGEGVQ